MTAAYRAQVRPWGGTTCAVANTDGRECGNAARIHLLIELGHARGVLNCCDTCFADLTLVRYFILDTHRFGDCCGLPDSVWVPSTPDGPGTCQLPDALTEDIERFANQPEGALA